LDRYSRRGTIQPLRYYSSVQPLEVRISTAAEVATARSSAIICLSLQNQPMYASPVG
jgi:hypothetical protein